MGFSACASYVRIRKQAAANRREGQVHRALLAEQRADMLVDSATSEAERVDLHDAEEACDELASNPGTTPGDWEALISTWEAVHSATGPSNHLQEGSHAISTHP